MKITLRILQFIVLAALVSPSAFGAEQGSVKIIRDGYGVPHIYADKTYGLFYGYGYAVAQDRLFQIEMIRRSAMGTVAEVLGPDYLSFDKNIRSSYDLRSIRAQVEALPKERRDILDGYAAGMNAWIAEVEKAPGKYLPREYSDFGFTPSHWTAVDVAMVFVGAIAHRFSDFNTELENLAYLNDLIARHGKETGWQIFNQTNWINDPTAPTTVPGRNAGKFSERQDMPTHLAGLGGSTKQKLILDKDGSYFHGTEEQAADYRARELASSGLSGPAGYPSASNIWVVGKNKAKGVNGVLLNGPQFGWITPSYVYNVGLHGAGYDLVGNAYFASPAVFFGRNDKISWGSTAGMGDTVDIYAEKLNPANPREYHYNGAYKSMDKRLEVIKVKDSTPVTIEVLSTVHGAVEQMDEANGVAYSRKRTWEGRELETLMAFVDENTATDWDSFMEAASRCAVSVNWYFLDQAGNIGYAIGGHYPERPAGQDPRLPASGTGDMEWQGMKPFSTNAQVYNPDTGYIVNWNNKPSDDWDNADPWYFIWTKADRVNALSRELEAKDRLTVKEVEKVNEAGSFADVNVRFFLPHLERAVAELPDDAPEKRLVRLLTDWDKQWTDKNRDGYYDSPANAIMHQWLTLMLEKTLKDDVGGKFFYFYASPGYATEPMTASVNVSPGARVLFNALQGKAAGVPQVYDFFNGEDKDMLIRRALTETRSALSNRFGGNADDWLLPVAKQIFRAYNFYGIPQTTPEHARAAYINMNRGSENNVVVMTDKGITSKDVVAPGQSGFIAPDGTEDKHFNDQMGLYESFRYKPLPFSEKEVKKAAKSSIVLEY
ncbi:penicillin acylase family protein [Emcibacter sp.]|uniref:penicillin acylase family protein n=1 Tax=Emcibacter sp. TaxID=1979954 RepID=UPI002AA62C21|nr:penicillin acylase family protein [Emcibacter sp.]